MAFMSSTSKAIYDVVVQIHPSKSDYVGQVCEGKYCYEDGVVTLVDHHGNPVKNYAQKIGPGENPRLIAARMTKQFYLARRGKSVNGFDGPIAYPPLPEWM